MNSRINVVLTAVSRTNGLSIACYRHHDNGSGKMVRMLERAEKARGWRLAAGALRLTGVRGE